MADRDSLVARYLELTREALPRAARAPGARWPVREDHCFQRIILDAVCGGRWTDHLDRPAYRHLSAAQAAEAVSLAEDILAGRANLAALNRQSLYYRGKG